MACVLIIFAVAGLENSLAWSTASSRTESDIEGFDMAIRAYQWDTGQLSKQLDWKKLERYSELRKRDASGAPLDGWGRHYIYRAPGQHGAFDFYSIGANGIDDHGQLDDISNWAGVNEGYYYKRTWPRGRLTIALGISLGLASLLLASIFTWRFVLPIAGSIACLGVFLGCQWLAHPGIGPNGGFLYTISYLLSGPFLIAFLIKVLREEGIVIRRKSAEPQTDFQTNLPVEL